MVINKRKKVLIAIIIAVLLLGILSFAVTGAVYDRVFARYDCPQTVHTDAAARLPAREEHRYPSGDVTLAGALFTAADNCRDTLLVLVPGHHACVDSYAHQIAELTACGWSVFGFDPTGSCRSGGESAIGFSQAVLDLDATLDYLEAQDRLGYRRIALIGHSRGGYAACCMLATDHAVSAVVSVSGVNSAMEGVVGGAYRYVGDLAYGNYGMLWLYQVLLFGRETVDLRADRLLTATATPTLLIHGEGDEQVPLERYSILSHRDEIASGCVEYYVRRAPANAGHTDLMFSSDGTADDDVIRKIDEFLSENGN